GDGIAMVLEKPPTERVRAVRHRTGCFDEGAERDSISGAAGGKFGVRLSGVGGRLRSAARRVHAPSLRSRSTYATSASAGMSRRLPIETDAISPAARSS